MQGLIQGSEGRHIPCSDALRATARTMTAKPMDEDRIAARGPVCVIDDDDWVCDSLSVLLETYGFEVLAYASGRQFLRDDRHVDAKCLVVDQHMPDLDGLEVVAAVQREEIDLPAILITGRLDAAIAQRAGRLGVLAVLEKPFPVARLVELIRRALNPAA